MQWSYLAKHPDEAKPPLPYHSGATIPALRWDPPPNDPIFHNGGLAKGQLQEELQNEHPLATCLRYTEATDAPTEGERVELQVVDAIRVMDGRHSQIAKVKVLDNRSVHENSQSPLKLLRGQTMTAKFYDPLYQDIEDEMPDIFGNTYNACYRETCVYRQLKPLWGTVIPRFHGSFRAKVPVPGRPGRSRWVYAILYEYVPGTELSYIDVNEWSQAERMAIMKAIIDADSKMWQAGIYQRDLLPRNVILQGRPGRPVSVKVIDFDYAFFESDFNPDEDELEPEPPSVIVDRWTDELRCPVECFRDLVDWPWDEWIRAVYLR
ncbi:hypothetical protein KVR01_011558 [Diaporthe batatas]|uniref:uncharacterized protein n=1 Tax=Diaporthe batatas TaxID=748121 RepID=UPI001D057698|nr:uncharacterized protein KVR01_011558 [Diaporthe batatas]KAG8158436.1 hypothetical protein KVR01_011558 [Diaporthe batatas]